ncbi:MAG: hypothetical protein INQ03_20105 [Candidatus Heimdallarchaeota archaeon]|nr:hypothetical protein [Candidatus Heimdallarchaeota archaeon]
MKQNGPRMPKIDFNAFARGDRYYREGSSEREKTPLSHAILGALIVLTLTGAILGYSIFHREAPTLTPIQITLDSGIVYDNYISQINDGLEVGFIIESNSDLNYYLIIHTLDQGEISRMSLNEIKTRSYIIRNEITDNRLSYQFKKEMNNFHFSLFIDSIPNQLIGESLDLIYFTQKGKLIDRTSSFFASLILFSPIFIVFYLPSMKIIKSYVNERKIRKILGNDYEELTEDYNFTGADIFSPLRSRKKDDE